VLPRDNVIVPAPLFTEVKPVPWASVNVPPCAIDELLPELAATVNNVPPEDRQVVQVRFKVPPRDTVPPPPNGPVVFSVKEEFANCEFNIPAVPDKLVVFKPAIVTLLAP